MIYVILTAAGEKKVIEWNYKNREIMKEIKFKEEDGRIVVEDNETDALREINRRPIL